MRHTAGYQRIRVHESASKEKRYPQKPSITDEKHRSQDAAPNGYPKYDGTMRHTYSQIGQKYRSNGRNTSQKPKHGTLREQNVPLHTMEHKVQ